jgi:hypothetical protein
MQHSLIGSLVSVRNTWAVSEVIQLQTLTSVWTTLMLYTSKQTQFTSVEKYFWSETNLQNWKRCTSRNSYNEYFELYANEMEEYETTFPFSLFNYIGHNWHFVSTNIWIFRSWQWPLSHQFHALHECALVCLYRLVVHKVGMGQVFSEYFGFPCQSSFHQFLHNHTHLSSGDGTIGQ